MFTYVDLKCFKSFSQIRLDLRKAHGAAKNLAFIYGENGSGKTNLISAFSFLYQSLSSLGKLQMLQSVLQATQSVQDSSLAKDVKDDMLQHVLLQSFSDLTEMYAKYKMLNSKTPMSLKFAFRLNGADGSYLMEFTEKGIVKEELRYQIKERAGVFFSLSPDHVRLSPSIFFDSAYRKELTASLAKYWRKHTFLAILNNELKTKNKAYLHSCLSDKLFTIMFWLDQLCVSSKQGLQAAVGKTLPLGFMQQLEKGVIADPADKELKRCETALNTYLTQLYSDIKSVYYLLTPLKDKYSYELYLKKQIDGQLLDIPFALESTGTKKLLQIFPLLLASAEGATVCIDEIDSGIHDLLMKDVLEKTMDSLKGQLIVTTHNTLLMQSLPAESTYLIRLDAKANKTIACVSDYITRTQKTNNMQTKYLRGDYEGTPSVGYFDFSELVDETPTGIYMLHDGEQDGIED